jgi:hypothetical protein
MTSSTMATACIRPVRLIVAAMLACWCAVIAAQEHRNGTFQVGQVNINRTWQCGETNQNSTYQDGRININQTRQGCRGHSPTPPTSPTSPQAAAKQKLGGQRLGRGTQGDVRADIKSARAAYARRR